MTDDRIALCQLVEKSADADLLREMIGFAAERLMEMEVGAATGAGPSARMPRCFIRPATPRFFARRMNLRLSSPNTNSIKKFMPRARANAVSGGPISEIVRLSPGFRPGRTPRSCRERRTRRW